MSRAVEESEALKRQIADLLVTTNETVVTPAGLESCAEEPLPQRREPMQEVFRQIQTAATRKAMR